MPWITWWQRWWRGEVCVQSTELWRRYFGAVSVQEVLRFSVREIVSSKQGRSVGKLEAHSSDGSLTVFLKRHYRLPWWQRITSLFCPGRSSAMQEWDNLRWADAAGFCVPEALAVGEQIGPGLQLQSYLAVRELANMLPLHQAIPRAWQALAPEEFRKWKTALLSELGRIVRRLHEARRFHKDLYLCHFFIAADCLHAGADLRQRIYLIDLHRMRYHRFLLWRWRIKDLAQLAFSMSVAGLGTADWRVFFRAYLGQEVLGPKEERLSHRVLRKAERYRWQNARHAKRQPKPYSAEGPPLSWDPIRSNSQAGPPPALLAGRALEPQEKHRQNPAPAAPEVNHNRRPLRIALCYDKVYPARGGMEVFIVDLIRRLVSDGHEVHLFAWQRDAQALPASLVFHRLPQRWMPRFLRPWYFAQTCERALQQHDFDVTVGFVKTWGQDVLVLGGGLHIANAEHNLLKYRSPWARWLARGWRFLDICHWSYLLLERKQFTRSWRPLIVAVSEMVKRHCRDYYHIPDEQMRVLHAAIDPKRFCQRDRQQLRHETRQALGIPQNTAVALFVGHNYALKGLVPLLRAMQVLRGKPLHLIVCGSRKDETYRQLAARLGVSDRVHFLGYQSDVRRCFFAADFVVHPTFYDPCSLVVMEALACGLPVITSRYNGAAELLSPPLDGFVLDDPHDYWRLAEYLDLLTQPDIRQRCSEYARLAACRWTMDDLYQSLLGVFYEVVARKQSRIQQVLARPTQTLGRAA
ncbi:Lipopolysaccharide core biosynthesis protein RfaG [bacterium HR36]|nr:Lipopolysaccharide core biosynthesis protein RfaG [bacterium HR36]